MRLSPARFNRLLNRLGQRARWRPAHACPCQDTYSGAARPDCGACGGVGTVWEAPVEATVALAGQKIQQAWREFGLYEEGDVVLSLPSDSPAYAIHAHDRLVLLNSSAPFSITRVRGAETPLKFELERLERLFWLAPDDSLVEGSVPTIGAAGEPVFGAVAPPDGVRYTLTGRKHPEYFHFRDLLQDRAHQHGAALPRRVVLRDFDLFARSL